MSSPNLRTCIGQPVHACHLFVNTTISKLHFNTKLLSLKNHPLNGSYFKRSVNLEMSGAEVAVEAVVLHPQVLVELPEVGKLDRISRPLRLGVGLGPARMLLADRTPVLEKTDERSL